MPRPPHAADCPPDGPDGDCRCLCGSLLARRVGGAVELKCRRCKRTLLIPLADDSPSAGFSEPSFPVRTAG